MNKLNLRRTFGLIGTIAVLGLVFVTAQAATIDCNGQFTCVGTDSNDTLIDSEDTAEIQGLGGDDSIDIEQGFTPANNNNNNTDQGRKDVFGGTGNDTFRVGADGNNNNQQLSSVNVFGESGDDSFRIDAGGQNNNNGLGGLFDGGRGDDTILIDGTLGGAQNNNDQGGSSTIKDGPGRDTVFQNAGDNQNNNSSPSFTVQLAEDNEPDTVRLDVARDEQQNQNNGANSVTIVLSRSSGRDVIQCRNPNVDQDENNNNQGNIRRGTIFLNGNRKAIDPQGNNLFDAARLGGVAETGCAQIIR